MRVIEMTEASASVETIDHGVRSGMVALVETILRDQDMPAEELRVVLTSGDAEVVRRHLELHIERLEEGFAEQRRLAASARRILSERDDRLVEPVR